MSRPARRTMPASGASWPFSMLKQVLLPAPLGPISASISPAETAKETSATACTPPKALCRPSTWRTASLMRAASCQRAKQRLQAADQSLREEQHDQQDDAAHDGAPEFGVAGDGVAQPGVDRRADHRAGQRLDAAQQHHDQPVGRLADRDGRGRDAALGEGVDRAGEARERADQHEGRPLEAAQVDADRLGAQRRIAAGAQREAEGREQHAPQQRDAGAAAGERQIVVGGLVGEPGRRPDAEHAVAAAGDANPTGRRSTS